MKKAGYYNYYNCGDYKADDEKPTDVVNLWGNPTKARTKLGWNPQKTSYEQLCAIMAEHDLQFARKEVEI